MHAYGYSGKMKKGAKKEARPDGETGRARSNEHGLKPMINNFGEPSNSGARIIDFNLADRQGVVPAGDIEAACLAACESVGIKYRDVPADGRFHRTGVIGKSSHNDAGSLQLFTDSEGGIACNWVTNEKIVFWASQNSSLSPAEKEERTRRNAEAVAEAEQKRRERQETAKVEAVRLWAESSPVSNEHPYIIKKGIKPVGLRQHGDILLIPLHEIGSDDLSSLQRIHIDGTKRFIAGTVMGSLCHVIPGNDGGTVYVCEGYATGASIHAATGAPVIVAFSSGRLSCVAAAVRKAFPSCSIVIAGDIGNGSEKAAKAAQEVQGTAVFPVMPELSTGTDFNDLQVAAGIEEVKRQLSAVNTCQGVGQLWVTGADLIGKPANIEFLIEGAIEANTTNAVTGPSGSGKSFAVLDQCLCIVTGKPWNDHKIIRPGAVLYLAGEGRTGVQRRVQAWAKHYEACTEDLQRLLVSKQTLLMDGSNIEAICRSVDGMNVSLMVIDTLARHIEGDENSTPDMSAFIKHVDELRDRLKTTVVIVHHTGHTETHRGRGSSAFKAALDTEVLCKGGALTWTKTKDMPEPQPVHFKLMPVEIGVDENGKPITSCIVEYVERAEANADRLTSFEQMAVEALITVSAEENRRDSEGRYVARLDSWRDEFYRMRRKEDVEINRDTLKSQFRRASGNGENGGGLKAKGIVKFTDDGPVLIGVGDQAAVNFAIISSKGVGCMTGA